jgi:hypothetical protein
VEITELVQPYPDQSSVGHDITAEDLGDADLSGLSGRSSMPDIQKANIDRSDT